MNCNWAVVATVDEPAALVAAFAAHHLAQGASKVHVFLDRPDAEAEALLAKLPLCHVTVCDDAYWRGEGFGKRPPVHTQRQKHNAQRVYDQTSADWLLHCDADEFIRDGQAVAAALQNAAPKMMYMRLLVSERAYALGASGPDIFAGVFRQDLTDFAEDSAAIYGEMNPFFHYGLTGHKAGKAIVRTRAGQKMGLHAPADKPPHRPVLGTRMLHFDGLTRLHYCLKLLRRAHEPEHKTNGRHGLARSMQFLAFRERVTDPVLREDLISSLKNLEARQMDHLQRLGCFDARAFDPNPAATAAGLSLDLTEDAFDAALKLRYADFLGQYAPDLL